MTLAEFKPKPGRSVRQQIVTQLRESIRSGELAPGTKLPSTQDLATTWNTVVPSVHRAMTDLVREGLLERAPRTGTFVRQPDKRLTDVGIYLTGNVWESQAARFLQNLCSHIESTCRDRQLRPAAWIDPRPPSEQERTWDRIEEAARRREFQALVVPVTDRPHLRWLRKLPIPVSCLSSDPLPGGVMFHSSQFLEAGLASLAARGCRRVGIITVLHAVSRSAASTRSPQPANGFCPTSFKRQVQDFGMTTSERWICASAPRQWVSEDQAERYGFERFRTLWEQPERPDGMIIFTDVAARGVLLALATLGVNVPGDLKLALHRNAELGLLCPVPAVFLDVRVQEVAGTLIDQATRLFNGERPAPAVLGYHVTV